jgi:xanthine dehydrogenase accessory factor
MVSATRAAAARWDDIGHLPGPRTDDAPTRYHGASSTPDVLRFLAAALSASGRAVLVTLVGVEGSSSRSIGTIMAVAEDGAHAGSLSGGCVEAAVVAEALDVLADGAPRLVRFGQGSAYIDIRLPCGGGLDLMFNPLTDGRALDGALSELAARREVALAQWPDRPDVRCVPLDGDPATGWRGDCFILKVTPPLRVLVAGSGAECIEFARLAIAYGAEADLWSPDTLLLRKGAELGASVRLLKTAGSVERPVSDRWTAIILFFHDHDWEPPLLALALAVPTLTVGAMGSPATHVRRLTTLRTMGVPEDALARIVAPLGLIPSARDPGLLALSSLAQVADIYARTIAWTCAGRNLADVPPSKIVRRSQ